MHHMQLYFVTFLGGFFTCNSTLTSFWVHGEVRLPLQDAVHHPGAVPVRGIIRIYGRHLNYRCAWRKKIHGNDLDQLFNTAENCLLDNWLS